MEQGSKPKTEFQWKRTFEQHSQPAHNSADFGNLLIPQIPIQAEMALASKAGKGETICVSFSPTSPKKQQPCFQHQ